MLRILFALSIMLFSPTGHCSDPHNIVSEPEELNSEEIRQIASCMIQLHKELLEVPVDLKKDSKVYEFFIHKKGKKYKIYNGQCTLGKLKIFSEYLQEDIEDLTLSKADLLSIRNQFDEETIASEHAAEILDSYAVANSKDLEAFILHCDTHLMKLAKVKTHIDILTSALVPKLVTARKAWKFFKSHLPDYFENWSKAKISSFKPRFLEHVRDYYGI